MIEFLLDESDFRLKDQVCILYFYSTWMIEHKKILFMFDKLFKKHSVKVFGIDVDTFKNYCSYYKVNSIPTFIVLNQGKEIKRLEGLTLTKAFISFFDDILNNRG